MTQAVLQHLSCEELQRGSDKSSFFPTMISRHADNRPSTVSPPSRPHLPRISPTGTALVEVASVLARLSDCMPFSGVSATALMIGASVKVNGSVSTVLLEIDHVVSRTQRGAECCSIASVNISQAYYESSTTSFRKIRAAYCLVYCEEESKLS